MRKIERKIEFIVIHTSLTFPDMTVDAEWIRRVHVDQNGWSDIGYHEVITRHNGVEPGRPIHLAGAHVAGHNHYSVGVCMVGGLSRDKGHIANYTRQQWRDLEATVMKLKMQFPDAKVVGHNYFDPSRGCPLFDAEAWWNEVQQ